MDEQLKKQLKEQQPASKPWWASRGVWGPLISVAAMGAQAAGVGADVDVSGLLHGVLDFVVVAGAALGWWGRVEAKAPIDGRRILPGFSF